MYNKQRMDRFRQIFLEISIKMICRGITSLVYDLILFTSLLTLLWLSRIASVQTNGPDNEFPNYYKNSD